MNKARFFPKTQYAKEMIAEVKEFKLIKEIDGEYLFADPGAIYGTNKKGEKGFIKFQYWFLIPKDQIMVISRPGGMW